MQYSKTTPSFIHITFTLDKLTQTTQKYMDIIKRKNRTPTAIIRVLTQTQQTIVNSILTIQFKNKTK